MGAAAASRQQRPQRPPRWPPRRPHDSLDRMTGLITLLILALAVSPTAGCATADREVPDASAVSDEASPVALVTGSTGGLGEEVALRLGGWGTTSSSMAATSNAARRCFRPSGQRGAAPSSAAPTSSTWRRSLTARDLVETVHVYPNMSEAIKMVAQTFDRDVSTLSCCAA